MSCEKQCRQPWPRAAIATPSVSENIVRLLCTTEAPIATKKAQYSGGMRLWWWGLGLQPRLSIITLAYGNGDKSYASIAGVNRPEILAGSKPQQTSALWDINSNLGKLSFTGDIRYSFAFVLPTSQGLWYS